MHCPLSDVVFSGEIILREQYISTRRGEINSGKTAEKVWRVLKFLKQHQRVY